MVCKAFGMAFLILAAAEPGRAQEKSPLKMSPDSAAAAQALPSPAAGDSAAASDSALMAPSYIKLDDATRKRMEAMGETFQEREKPKPTNISNVFSLNTIDPAERRFPPRANDDQGKPTYKGEYYLPRSSRVLVRIFQRDSLVKRLAEEEQFAGTHSVFWDGLSEYGVKLFGDFECRVQYRDKEQAEKTMRFKFKVGQ